MSTPDSLNTHLQDRTLVHIAQNIDIGLYQLALIIDLSEDAVANLDSSDSEAWASVLAAARHMALAIKNDAEKVTRALIEAKTEKNLKGATDHAA